MVDALGVTYVQLSNSLAQTETKDRKGKETNDELCTVC